jgi:hypothetical protein
MGLGAVAGATVGAATAAGAFALPPHWQFLLIAALVAMAATFIVHLLSTATGPGSTGTRLAYAALATVIPALGLSASRSANVIVRWAGAGSELAWPAVSGELATNLHGGLPKASREAVQHLVEEPTTGLRAALITRIGLGIAGLTALSTILLGSRGTTVLPLLGAAAGSILAALPILRLRPTRAAPHGISDNALSNRLIIDDDPVTN